MEGEAGGSPGARHDGGEEKARRRSGHVEQHPDDDVGDEAAVAAGAAAKEPISSMGRPNGEKEVRTAAVFRRLRILGLALWAAAVVTPACGSHGGHHCKHPAVAGRGCQVDPQQARVIAGSFSRSA